MRLLTAPLEDLRGYSLAKLRADGMASLAVTFLAIPQAVAYAVIAGLPPAAGLYSAAVPAIVGGLFRSSRFVVTGPSNALSLLAGAAIGRATTHDPVTVAVTLAVLTGAFQVAAGLARLGRLTDYVSRPVVTGYVTGAAALIAAGQVATALGVARLPSLTEGGLPAIAHALARTHPLTLAVASGSTITLLLVRRYARRVPGPLVVLGVAIAAGYAVDYSSLGIATLGGTTQVERGLPPLTFPDLTLLSMLVPAALACAGFSLVESVAVAQLSAAETGERFDRSGDFFGQGLANVVAGFTGGYPTSGSLGRSALLLSSGAQTRIASALTGVVMLASLAFLAPMLDRVPLACLSGLLFVIAADLVDAPRIRRTLRAQRGDALALVATLVGTWVVPLDRAVYLGVGISVVTFLRRVRLLVVRELVIDTSGHFREEALGASPTCHTIRVLHIEGPLFFGAAGELEAALDDATRDPRLRVLIVRLKRVQAIDTTTAGILEQLSRKLRRTDQHLILAGVRPRAMELLERTGASATLGHDHIFPSEPTWFGAMEHAVGRAVELAGPHHEDEASCPLTRWADQHARETAPMGTA